MTKKSILWVGLVGTIIFFTISILVRKYGCREDLFFFCKDSYVGLVFILKFLFPVMLFLSLITYKMRDEIFRSWIKFSYVWIPLTIILTLLAPEYSPSLLPLTKGVISFYFSALFLLISIIIIISKSIFLRRK